MPEVKLDLNQGFDQLTNLLKNSPASPAIVLDVEFANLINDDGFTLVNSVELGNTPSAENLSGIQSDFRRSSYVALLSLSVTTF